MELSEAIYGRRSIRKYKKEDVPDEVIMRAIDFARHAPSAGNTQPWEFIIVREIAMKKKLYRASFSQSHVLEAPVLIVVCADLMKSAYYGMRGRNLYAIQDTAAAIENILLGFYSMGYDTCWVGAFSEHVVREALALPQDIRPMAIITVGKREEEPKERELREMEEMVHIERW